MSRIEAAISSLEGDDHVANGDELRATSGGGQQLASAIGGIGGSYAAGGMAIVCHRDRLYHLKYAPDDNRQLLAIIGISQPIVFGNVEFDTGSPGFILGRTKPSEMLEKELKDRLALPAANVEKLLRDEFDLREPAYVCLLETIRILVDRVKPKERILIHGDMGRILADVPNAGEYFEIATHGERAPRSYADVIAVLMGTVGEAHGATQLPLHPPAYPTFSAELKAPSPAPSSVRDYVEAIVLREHDMADHMAAVEKYYVDVARSLGEYNDALRKVSQQ